MWLSLCYSKWQQEIYFYRDTQGAELRQFADMGAVTDLLMRKHATLAKIVLPLSKSFSISLHVQKTSISAERLAALPHHAQLCGGFVDNNIHLTALLTALQALRVASGIPSRQEHMPLQAEDMVSRLEILTFKKCLVQALQHFQPAWTSCE